MRVKSYVIPNWADFQHYKDRSPPWIKLHRSLIDSYEFSKLPDAAKAHLMMIWLLASQHQGRIPADPEFLCRKLGLTETPDLELLERTGFLTPERDDDGRASAGASNALAERKQVAPMSARSEEERREEKRSPPAAASDPVKDVFDLAVGILTKAGKSESSARSLIGRIRRDVGDDEAMRLLMAAKKTTDPAAYIAKAAAPKPRRVQLC